MARILVVDDSKFMRMTLKNMIEGAEHTVVGEADDDNSAVIKYKELKPDLVTMDIIMPIDSGIKAVKEIIQFDPEAKIIMVSAMGQDEVIKEALDLGAKAFVVKPVKPQELKKAIEAAVGK